MIPRIGHRSDAVDLLKAILRIDRDGFGPLSCRVNEYDASLLECIEALLDAIERGII